MFKDLCVLIDGICSVGCYFCFFDLLYNFWCCKIVLLERNLL